LAQAPHKQYEDIKWYIAGETVQWSNGKEQTMIHITLQRKLNIEQHETQLKIGGELSCPGKVTSYFPTITLCKCDDK
jgi:hypothetical protein